MCPLIGCVCVCVCVTELCVCVIGLGATRQNIMGLLAINAFVLAGVRALETGRCLLTGCVCVYD